MNTDKIMQAFEEAFLLKEREEMHQRLENLMDDTKNELVNCKSKLEWIIDNAKTFEEVCGCIRRIDELADTWQKIDYLVADCEYWRDVITGEIKHAYK